MKRLFFLLLVSLPFQVQAQQDMLQQILVYGLPGPPSDRLTDELTGVVSKKYGFEYYSVGGCVIPSEKQDSVEKHNDRVRAILARKNGKNWEKRYNRDILDKYKQKEEAEALVSKEPALAVKSAGAVIGFRTYPGVDDNTCKVYVFDYQWSEVFGDLLYMFMVHRKEKKVVPL